MGNSNNVNPSNSNNINNNNNNGASGDNSNNGVPHSLSAPHQLGQPTPLTPLAQHHQALAQQLQQRFAISNNNGKC